MFQLQKEKNAQTHLKEGVRWSTSLQMDAALLETGKKKSQEEETTERQYGKQKTCKRLITTLISNPCSGLEQKEHQGAKPSLGRVAAR